MALLVVRPRGRLLRPPARRSWPATARRDDGRVRFGRATASGTSFAVALAAGAAALWLAKHGRAAIRARYGPANVQAAFLRLARTTAAQGPGWDAARYGAGILDAGALLGADLPSLDEIAGARAGATGADRANRLIDRIAAVTPELTPRELRRALADLLGVRTGQVHDGLTGSAARSTGC